MRNWQLTNQVAIRPILTVPDPFLRKKCKPVSVEHIADHIKQLSQDMIETMVDAQGIGLSANQVGVDARLIVVYLGEEEQPDGPLIMINPEIDQQDQEKSVYNEGCLSVPEQYAEITRPAGIHVHWYDLNQTMQKMYATGLMATCIQHEIDHLNGKVFIDYLSPIKRNMIVRKVKKITRETSKNTHQKHNDLQNISL
ncbi:MAG: peptide deformylase [Pseudomonadota bacterium]